MTFLPIGCILFSFKDSSNFDEGGSAVAFNSAAFLFFFFPLAFLLYALAPGIRVKNALLAVFSLIFYAFGQWQGLPLLVLAAVISYVAGRLMDRPSVKKPAAVLAVVLDLGLLGCFQYLDFFTGILNRILPVDIPEANLLLPVGISFFIFKSMSYVVDAYRDSGRASRSFLDVLLYISFFPQITSGPIARFDHFAAQLLSRPFDSEGTARGLRRFIVGFGKKMLIAGPVSAIVDSAFSLGGALDIRMAWLGAAAYTIQIYFDFSGYSDMAIGLGGVFGFETPENFRYPYIAASITDFWRRWHISLSSWFRDYLYIPLGGNRKGKARQALNKALVFLLCGLWHGASGTFVLWGIWHGVFSALESCRAIDCKRLQRTAPGRFLSHFYTLLVVCLGFVIFRAASLQQMLEVFRALFTGFAPTPAAILAFQRISPAAWLALAAGAVGCLPVGERLAVRAGKLGQTARGYVTAASFAAAAVLFVVCLLASAGSGFQPFIYAQF